MAKCPWRLLFSGVNRCGGLSIVKSFLIKFTSVGIFPSSSSSSTWEGECVKEWNKIEGFFSNSIYFFAFFFFGVVCL